MKQSDTQPSAAYRTLSDYYLMALWALLAGYAIVGKPFAYIGVPPVYVGEIVFALGIIAFLNSKCAVAAFATLPSLLLGVLVGWTILRTLPYLGEFGVDALRDSVIVVYGGFALIIVALLLERPERILLIIRFLRVVATIAIVVAPCLLVLRLMGIIELPVKAGLVADHLAGAGLLILLGFMRASVGWRIILLIGIALIATQSRGAMLAVIIPTVFAMIATGRLRKLAAIVVTTGGLIGLAYMVDLSIPIPSATARQISATQLAENFASVFKSSDSGNLAQTTYWRELWWKTIFDYTFEGPYFWTGKGFGINLAAADGFVAGDPDEAALRSPHSAHLTILARAGVPGLALWLLSLGIWSTTLLVNMVRARRFGDHAWADLFVLIFCYALAFIIDGTFDVALEGPMAGIWFWFLFGVGIGATMIYRASLQGIEQRGSWRATTQAVGRA